MKVTFDWLKEYVGEEMPTIKKLEELLTFHAFEVDGVERVGNHEVIDVKILPDRSSDCLSHRGIAKEVGALIGKPLAKDPFTKETPLSPKTEKVTVTIESSENCRRFGGALMTGITIKESPDWLKERLQALGQRSINSVVDATNYVMLALGQPLHAYDAEKFPHEDGVWRFGVRMARDGEEVTTLSSETYTLKNNVQLIVDESTDVPVGIAGIKGGKFAEIDASTTSIIIEAANFNPQVTRRATQTLKLQTDASKRFENNLSPELVPYALIEIVALIQDIAGGVCEGYVDLYPNQSINNPVSVTLEHINALLGVTLTETVIEDILARLSFGYTRAGNTWSVTAPFERTDITISEDVIAEVGRVYGYEHVASVKPTPVPLTEYNTRHFYSEKIRVALIAEGFSEVITSSFRKKDAIELQNALASDKRFLRSSLRENICETLDRNMPNLDLLGLPLIQVFEIGTAFMKTSDDTDVTEEVLLAIGVRTKQQGSSPKDDERLKEVLAKLEQILGVSFEATITQGVLECSITNLLTKLPAPTSYETYTPERDVTFTPYSAYPFISRDIALWVPEGIGSAEVETLIRAKSGNLLTRLNLFDEFKKEGKISYAFRLIFQSFEKTLTDEEINAIMETIYIELQGRGFEIR